jgi:hypothetical protein
MMTRPPEMASMVANALATCSGCRYDGTYTWLRRRTSVVMPASQPSVATVSHHSVPMTAAFSDGMAMWSHTPM